MKKNLLSFTLFISLGASAQNVNIPDANFKAYLVGNASINTNMDTEIQVSEAAAFTGTINCVNLNIANLTGIEAFTSLTALYCYNNPLTSLDVSNNTALTVLISFNNQLTSLDVSTNTALNYLTCSANQLTSLDVSNNTALIELYCDQNQLTSLNVSNASALTLLDCKTNQLTSLGLSTNTALTNLNCNTNQLTSLNVSNNTALTELQCAQNQLISLDVSSNNALIQLYCNQNQLTSLDVSNSLTLLYCTDNQLTYLDLSNNNTLVLLYCFNNQLSSLDLTNNTNLTVVQCQSNQLINLNVANGNNPAILNFTAWNNPNLTCIEVDDAAYSTTNWTQIDATSSFSEECNPCIVTIPDANFKAYLIGNAAINTNSDTEIQCSEALAFTGQIWIQALGITDLTGIEAFTNLTSLNCNSNSLTAIDVSSNTSLVVLNIAGNSISALNVSTNTALSNLFCDYNAISTLNISNNVALTKLNINNNLLTSLDLSNNTQLIELGCESNALTALNVRNGNNINVTGFYVTGNPNLTCIEVDDATYSTTNWTNIDATASFSENCSLGIQESNSLSLNVYPNPAIDQLTIQTENSIENISIFNASGQLLQVEKETTFSVAHLAKGIYTILVQCENGVTTTKFIKE